MRRAVLTGLAGLVTVPLLLTGCSGGGDESSTEQASLDAGGGGGAPPPAPAAPAPAAPEGGYDAAPEAAGKELADSFAPAPDMVSTFALDVDTASYSYARRTIDSGSLPQPDTVRHEEFINSFRQDYPAPEDDGFSVTTDGARAADGGWSLMRVGLATRPESNEYGTQARRPAALTFVVDVSGSMAEPGRLSLVREALHTAVDELRDDDALALVAFSGEARTVLPMTAVGGAEDRIHDAVEELQPTDSTNVEAGMTRGYDEAVAGHREGATNRVVLLSDALANTGATDADTILDRITAAREDYGITLFGVGVGSEYGDALMERLTNQGDGHTTYVSETDEARKVFVEDLPRNVDLRARDAKAQVVFDADAVADYRLIGYDNRQVADEDFRNDAVDGGEVGPGHTVTALYAVRLAEGASGSVATATVRWLDPDTRAPHEESSSVDAGALTGDLWGAASPRLQLTALTAYFADALRGGSDAGTTPEPRIDGSADGSAGREEGGGTTGGAGYMPLPGAPTVDELAGHAEDLAAETEDPAVGDLAETVRQAVELTA
ncbi:von Willebrand factor type A domain-containing protein [Streptomyces sp. WMMC500]|uniref:vWA domain-containing protein n=1 Tax=Streptomyces sp. WMMC500 TaxID=3015154 RepID=UPI00248C053D|nr:von Willebrand factor type A domain-containing protein [Streptomyces sp. WMMC500]WBB59223.1 von Willebrand factor type A domain-containing protein [Streptomyces sp. WMMC500]